jgi:major capsid protein E
MPTASIPPELLYRTSTLVETFVQLPAAASFLKDQMFPRTITVASDLVSVEFYKGNQRLAPYCSRSKGTAVPREKEQLSLFSPPFIKPVRLLTADELFYKSAPTPAAGAPENRDAVLLARDYSELDSLISRREEWMASQCLFSGKATCLDGDTGEITAELTYGSVSKTVPAKPWSDPTSDPLADLRGALRLVSGACGASADLIVMGKNAADAFEANVNVISAYDKLRISPGELTAKNVSLGVQSLGTYRGLPLYVNESEYQDTDGTMKPFVPVDNVLIAATSLGGCFSYAGIAQVNDGESVLNVYEGTRIPSIAHEAFEDIRKFRLSSRPCPVPQNLAAWTILDVL